VGREDLGVVSGLGLVVGGHDDVPGALGEAAEALARVQVGCFLALLGDEALVGRLSGDPQLRPM